RSSKKPSEGAAPRPSPERAHSLLERSRSAIPEDALVQGQFFKLNQNVLGSWDPDKTPTYAFTSNVEQARKVYGDTAVVAAIPVALEGDAKKWFRSLGAELDDP